MGRTGKIISILVGQDEREKTTVGNRQTAWLTVVGRVWENSTRRHGGRRWGRMGYMKGKGKSQITVGSGEGRQMGQRVMGKF